MVTKSRATTQFLHPAVAILWRLKKAAMTMHADEGWEKEHVTESLAKRRCGIGHGANVETQRAVKLIR